MDPNAVLEILDGIKLKGSLLTHTAQHTVVDFISDRVKSMIPSLASVFKSIELLRVICECVENCGIDKKKCKGLDKKAIVLDIYRKLYPTVTDKDLAEISANIEDLLSNGLVKKISNYRRLSRYLCSDKKKG